jgi:AraC-like DNA-binding protein
MSYLDVAGAPSSAAPALASSLFPNRPWPGPAEAGLPLETTWRQVAALGPNARDGAAVIASRWIDGASGRRRAEAQAPAGRHVLSVALRRTRVRLTSNRREIFDGVMASGTVHLTGPSRVVEAEFQAPCDFVHLYIAESCLRGREGAGCASEAAELDGIVQRDPLAGQLARTLTEDACAGDPAYAESVARTILLRIAALNAQQPPVSALPKWRLRRVQEHVQRYLGDSICLADLANAAGLSRSYFAAQFRAATGFQPHEYVTEQRIDRAKELLVEANTPIVEVALAVGFQTQAHFSTVFKRLTGSTPARWRLARLYRH